MQGNTIPNVLLLQISSFVNYCVSNMVVVVLIFRLMYNVHLNHLKNCSRFSNTTLYLLSYFCLLIILPIAWPSQFYSQSPRICLILILFILLVLFLILWSQREVALQEFSPEGPGRELKSLSLGRILSGLCWEKILQYSCSEKESINLLSAGKKKIIIIHQSLEKDKS